MVVGGEEEILIEAVEDVRELVRMDLPPGLEVEVTGPAGFSADASKAFEGINSTCSWQRQASSSCCSC